MKSFIEFQKEEVELGEEQIEERNKLNATMRKSMDADRGAKFKARNDTTTPDPEPQHKTDRAHNKAIGRAIRQMSNEEVDLEEATHNVPHREWEDIVKQKHPDVQMIKNMNQHGIHTSTHAIIKGKYGGEKVGQYTMHNGVGTLKGSKPHQKIKEEVELDETSTPSKDKVQDRKTGKWYDPKKEFNKLMDKPEVKAQMKRMAKTDVKEESELDEEQLDELSPKTLGSYIKKASGEATKSREAEKHWDKNDSDERGLHYANKNHAEKREKGIKTATDKSEKMADKGIRKAVGKLLNTEEVEQIDELSKDTLVSYEKKARVAAHKHALASELKGLAADPAGSYAHKMMADKRHAGWKVAVKKLNTEETDLDEEQLDELSKKTLGSYVNKAAKDTNRLGMVLHKGEWIHKVTTQPNRVKGIATAVDKLTKEESDTPFEGPYKQSKGTVTDKSGAKHTPLSNVRSLARNAIEKMKQKMRMAHLSPEVRAEKLARNEELVGGQKKLDVDKDGKIEKSDLETIRTKKLKEDVTTAAQKLKAALDRHTEHAVAANRAGDHDAVKVHQGYANKIKTQLGKLAKNEEVEIEEAAPTGIKIYHKGQDDKESHTMVFSAADAAKHEKELKQQGRKVTGRSVMSGKTEGPRKSVTEEVEITEAEMTDAEMAKREKIVKGMKKSFKDFTAKYGDRAKEVMYATATKRAMEEEVEEELEEDMDEGVTTRNGAVTVHKGTYGTSYQGDDEDDEDTPEKKEPAVKRGRGRPAGAKSGAKPKGSSAGKSYGGLTIHSLRLPNNNK